jgi:hypothetical protein
LVTCELVTAVTFHPHRSRQSTECVKTGLARPLAMGRARVNWCTILVLLGAAMGIAWDLGPTRVSHSRATLGSTLDMTEILEPKDPQELVSSKFPHAKMGAVLFDSNSGMVTLSVSFPRRCTFEAPSSKTTLKRKTGTANQMQHLQDWWLNIFQGFNMLTYMFFFDLECDDSSVETNVTDQTDPRVL